MRGPLPDPARDGRRRRQDLPDAPGGAAGAGGGARRRDRLPRAARPARDGGARRGARGGAAPAERARRRSSSRRWTSTRSSAARRSWRSSTSSRTRTLPEARATRSATRTSTRSSTAGIDVISTVNIQHLESLNDAVFELTGVRVRETFPDRILDEADEVVLVDLTPGGAPGAAARAARSIPPSASTRRCTTSSALENLAALRELALRELAEDVEARRHDRPCSTRSASRRSPSASSSS